MSNSQANISALNDFVIRFANVNGTGSASANNMFAKALFRMGLTISPKNIFPSNIQGLPTWFEVRVNDKGYTGRRGGVDIALSVNPQSLARDIKEVLPGGFFIFDSSKPLDLRMMRDDITFIGLPLTDLCAQEFNDPRKQQLLKNVVYVGALAALLDIEFTVLTELVAEQFNAKEKLVAANIRALELGYHYASKHFSCPLSIRVARCEKQDDSVILDGNTACGLGAVYAGATVAGWYPITPSTSVIEAFETYCQRMRIDPGSGKHNYAIIQAEDELAAIGMVIGASWNGARAFTATSGPGISLMSEFLGLAYFAEIPAVLIDVQRAGPSTGMPTRTQQSDITACAYASHGDTKQILLFPATPKECFDLTVEAFDLAEKLQTPVILMSDLDLGMNQSISAPLEWDDKKRYARGKVLSEEQLTTMEHRYGRYLDSDGDGIPYRTYPGTHPEKGAFFTRGTSRDEYAVYTEDGQQYELNMQRLTRKWETAKTLMPEAEVRLSGQSDAIGLVFFGTSTQSAVEAADRLRNNSQPVDTCRIRSFPFSEQVEQFIAQHQTIFVIEQNRDAQMRSLLVNECELDPKRLIPLLHYDGMPITASMIYQKVTEHLDAKCVTPIKRHATKQVSE